MFYDYFCSSETPLKNVRKQYSQFYQELKYNYDKTKYNETAFIFIHYDWWANGDNSNQCFFK